MLQLFPTVPNCFCFNIKGKMSKQKTNSFHLIDHFPNIEKSLCISFMTRTYYILSGFKTNQIDHGHDT